MTSQSTSFVCPHLFRYRFRVPIDRNQTHTSLNHTCVVDFEWNGFFGLHFGTFGPRATEYVAGPPQTEHRDDDAGLPGRRGMRVRHSESDGLRVQDGHRHRRLRRRSSPSAGLRRSRQTDRPLLPNLRSVCTVWPVNGFQRQAVVKSWDLFSDVYSHLRGIYPSFTSIESKAREAVARKGPSEFRQIKIET